MSPRGILKAPSVFPLEHELPGYEEPRRNRSRSRSRDPRHADEALHVVTPSSKYSRERHTSTHKRRDQSRRRSKSRSRRHVRWTDPVAYVVSDGTDALALRQLRHRRSSLPSILEDTRTAFRESLREHEKNPSRSSDKDSSTSRHLPDTFHPSSSSSSSHRRPALKPTLSTPNVGRPTPSPRAPEQSLHAPTPISHEHRRRRISLPDGLEAAVKSPSHALWLPHHADDSSEHSTRRSSRHSTHLATPSAPHTNGHSRSSHSVSQPSNGHSHSRSASHSHATPHHHDATQLPPHAREQPHLRGSSHSAAPPVTFTSQQHPSARPLSQLTTSTHRSSKSSPSEKKTSPLPTPPMATAKEMEPQTPKSTRSNLFAFPTIDDIFSKDETSHSMMSVRRLFGLSTPKHEPRKLDDEKPPQKPKHSRKLSKESIRKDVESEAEQRRRADSFVVNPPARENLHRARHSFDLGTFSLLDDMHMRWTTATARHFLPVMTPAEIQASHLKPSLNPGLATVHWDIRHPPTAVWSVVPGRKTTLWKGHNEPAVVPLVPSLRIISPYFPWVISARNPAGVTCGDVLSAIHTSARQLVWRGEFDQLRQVDKDRLAAGYHANRPGKGKPKTADSPFDAGSWLVRADWLGRHTVLRGVSIGEARDKRGAPTSDILLTMYLTENHREGDKQALVLVRH